MTRAHWLAVTFMAALFAFCLLLIATAPTPEPRLTPQTVAPAVIYQEEP